MTDSDMKRDFMYNACCGRSDYCQASAVENYFSPSMLDFLLAFPCHSHFYFCFNFFQLLDDEYLCAIMLSGYVLDV